MLGCIGFGADETKDPVGELRGTGPDFLAIDDPLVTIELGFCG